jgi:hypothetical protein
MKNIKIARCSVYRQTLTIPFVYGKNVDINKHEILSNIEFDRNHTVVRQDVDINEQTIQHYT